MNSTLTAMVVVALVCLTLRPHTVQSAVIGIDDVHAVEPTKTDRNRNPSTSKSGYDLICGVCLVDRSKCPDVCRHQKEYSHLFG